MCNNQPGIIGEISEAVISTLGLSIEPGTPIYIGQSNIDHMISRHPEDYARYGSHIRGIIGEPDYVGINPGDGSIEYTKDFKQDNDYVKVAVRVSRSGKYFARSLFVRNRAKVDGFIANGTLKPLTKPPDADNIDTQERLL